MELNMADPTLVVIWMAVVGIAQGFFGAILWDFVKLKLFK